MFVKILTAGHEVPSDETILSFKRAVHRFLRDNADNGACESVWAYILAVVGGLHMQHPHLCPCLSPFRQADRSPLHPRPEPHRLPDLQVCTLSV